MNAMSDGQSVVTIRAIQADDHAQWLELWQAYQDFYEVLLDEVATDTTFQCFLNEASPVFCAVAVCNDQLVGFVHSVLHRSTWAVDEYCYLEDLYVTPTLRGGGAGKMLIEWVQRFAQQHQCARLYWHTHETNKRAQKLYNWVADKSGFIEYRMAL